MYPDGSLSPWRARRERRCRSTAAAPVIPWSDLVASLLPNGRTLDYPDRLPDHRPVARSASRSSPTSRACSRSARASGFYAPPGTDPEADLTTWYALAQRRRAV